jgi:hypothetical protein
MSDWGQGAKNNNIGWGQGAVNNDIGWGAVHADSWSGDTDIVGLDPIQSIINAFKTRVDLDGGTFEAESCLNTTLTNLNDDGLLDDASLIITPNAQEAGKLFSIVPTDGSGDLTVTRATTATYVGSDGLIKTAGVNEVRFDYTNGSCPSILDEPQRTNFALQSEMFSQNVWNVAQSTITPNTILAPDGTLTADTWTANGASATHNLFQSVSFVAGTTYTISLFVKKNTNNFIQITGSTNALGVTFFANFDIENGTLGTRGANAISSSIENYGNGWYRISATGIGQNTTSNPFTFIITNSANAVRNQSNTLSTSLYIWGAQLEAGSNATSYIPTTASDVTRNADVISKSGLSGITTITETFENGTTNVISGSPTSYTMSQGRIKQVIGV